MAKKKVPLFLTAAQSIAADLGVGVDSFLKDYGRAVQESDYPGPDCLEPEEVESYVASRTLERARLAHVNDCVPCSVLLESALPSEERKESFLALLRREGSDPLRKRSAPRYQKRARESQAPAKVFPGADDEAHSKLARQNVQALKQRLTVKSSE